MSTKLRKVIVYEWEEGAYFEKRVVVGEGFFHKWGCDYEEFKDGPGNFSTAIIEMSNGEVNNVRVDLITFKK